MILSEFKKILSLIYETIFYILIRKLSGFRSHGGVKAFDDYMCTSVNVKKCIAYIVIENDKICYSVQYIKVQDLYISTMLCTFYVYTG